MVDLEEIRKDLFEAGVFNSSFGRKYNWEEILNKNIALLNKVNELKKEYRTEDEMWFCIRRNFIPPKCPLCGNLCKFHGSTKYGQNGYNTTCGKCSANTLRAQKENEEKGKTVDLELLDERQRQAYNNMNKIFVFNCDSCNKSVSRKVRADRPNTWTNFLCDKCSREKTCLSKYGYKTNLIAQANPKKVWEEHREDILEKRKATSLAKYGCEDPSQNKEIKEKIQRAKQLGIETFELNNDCTRVARVLAKFGQGWKSKVDELGIVFLKDKNVKFVKNSDLPIIEKYSKEGTHTNKYVSNREKQVLEFVKSIYPGRIIENDTSTVSNNNHRNFELDIYLPDEKIAIDFDGQYYHSTKMKDKYYHQRKTLCCYKAGIRLAHVHETEWVDNRPEIEEKLKDLIFLKKSFNDGFFPSFEENIELSEPRGHQFGKLLYYDTGVII